MSFGIEAYNKDKSTYLSEDTADYKFLRRYNNGNSGTVLSDDFPLFFFRSKSPSLQYLDIRNFVRTNPSARLSKYGDSGSSEQIDPTQSWHFNPYHSEVDTYLFITGAYYRQTYIMSKRFGVSLSSPDGSSFNLFERPDESPPSGNAWSQGNDKPLYPKTVTIPANSTVSLPAPVGNWAACLVGQGKHSDIAIAPNNTYIRNKGSYSTQVFLIDTAEYPTRW